MRNTIGPTRRHFLLGSAAATLLPLSANIGWAESEYPSRPVRVIVPYPPGGGADTVSRILFAKLGESYGQQFVIDNRGGAGGTIAEAAAAKAEPDGYTVLFDATAFSVNPFLYQKLTFDPLKDFQPVFLASRVANILVVHPSVTAKTVADVIELAKSTPGGLDFASSGNGTVQHLSLEMFRHMTGTKINHVSYRGGGPALNDVISGQVKFFFANGSAVMGHIQSGVVKAIAHTGTGQLGTLPHLPAVNETVQGFEAYEWNGTFVPTGTSAAIITKLNAGLNETLKDAQVADRLKQLNVETRTNTPDEFRSFLTNEMAKWKGVVEEANIKLG